MTSEKKRGRGRPATHGTPVVVRVGPELLDYIDEWRRRQKDMPTRPEALRRFAEKLLMDHAGGGRFGFADATPVFKPASNKTTRK